MLTKLRFWFSLSRSALLACGPLFSYKSRANRCSLSHCWHNWPRGRLLAWHKGGVPSPNLTHLLTLLAAMMLVKQGRSMIDVFVLWFQLSEWREQGVLTPTVTQSAAGLRIGELHAAGAHVSCLCHREARQLRCIWRHCLLIVSQPAPMSAGSPDNCPRLLRTCIALTPSDLCEWANEF